MDIRPYLPHEEIARVAHEANRAYCRAIGDESQVPWASAPEWQKDSAIAGVSMHARNPLATPEDSHNSWLKQKQQDGWKYGLVKDPEKREHPCCVPYDQLPPEQRAKDYVFAGVVKTLLAISRGEYAMAAPDDFMASIGLILDTAKKLKAKMIERGLVTAWTKCPKCGGRIDAALAGRKNHLHMACRTPDCSIRLME